MAEWFGDIGKVVIAVFIVGIIYTFMNTNLLTFLNNQWTSILH